jgi:hypothetical protein
MADIDLAHGMVPPDLYAPFMQLFATNHLFKQRPEWIVAKNTDHHRRIRGAERLCGIFHETKQIQQQYRIQLVSARRFRGVRAFRAQQSRQQQQWNERSQPPARAVFQALHGNA